MHFRYVRATQAVAPTARDLAPAHKGACTCDAPVAHRLDRSAASALGRFGGEASEASAPAGEAHPPATICVGGKLGQQCSVHESNCWLQLQAYTICAIAYKP